MNSEVFRVNKGIEKIKEQLCADNTSVTSNTKEISQRCRYYKEIETAKYKIQIRIDSLSKNIKRLIGTEQ